MAKKKRDYRKEYDRYHGSPEQRKRRSQRVLSRRKAVKLGIVSKGDGRDVHHRDGNPGNKASSNLVAKSKSKNRSFPRTKTARKKRGKK